MVHQCAGEGDQEVFEEGFEGGGEVDVEELGRGGGIIVIVVGI